MSINCPNDEHHWLCGPNNKVFTESASLQAASLKEGAAVSLTPRWPPTLSSLGTRKQKEKSTLLLAPLYFFLFCECACGVQMYIHVCTRVVMDVCGDHHTLETNIWILPPSLGQSLSAEPRTHSTLAGLLWVSDLTLLSSGIAGRGHHAHCFLQWVLGI